MTCAGLLLAAGAGRRLGAPKALVALDGVLLVERGIALLRAGGCAPVVVVLGAAADRVLVEADLGGAVVVVAEDWDEGMGASLRAGLGALASASDVRACVVALVDQPGVGAAAVARLRAAWAAGAVAAVATYESAPRNPVLLDRCVWDEVADLAMGDVGARAWLRANPSRTTLVACEGTGTPFDIDTPDDLAAASLT